MIRSAVGEIEQFRAAIEAAGLAAPAAIVADGKLHRFATSARPARKRLARPITAFCSWISVRTPVSEAPSTGGTVG